jgi:HK97 family phage major capsid protein
LPENTGREFLMNKLKMQARLGETQTRRDEIKAKGEAATEADATEFKALVVEAEKLKADIDILTRGEALDATVMKAQPLPAGIVVNGPVAEEASYSLGEYMCDIAQSARGRGMTHRFENLQKKFKAAATGLSEAIPSDGGFLVGSDMMAGIMEKTFAESQLAGRCSRSTVSAGSNAVTLNGVSEKSRADGSRFGGVLGYWEGEADTITATKPKFYQVNLKLSKVTAAYYASDEVLSDAPLLQGMVNRMVPKELAFKLDDAIIRGTGAGQPWGYLNGPALKSVSKETGQAADTIKWENIKKMYAAMPAYNRRNAVWVANDECLPELMGMSMPVGTAGVPVWLPGNSAINQPFDTLINKPIFYAEQASALGDVGDISFVDFSQIQLIEKGGIQGASSIHVKFLESEQVFRFIYRVDARPTWESPMTQYKGSATQSPFVVLAARA